ncbi:O-methyltransferase family 3 protein [Daedalea quercina L-15889]|uniref:O-methyltransferase family 3 protein n=1 Tax=Daedalea quercina L-15889 TaxID=1314783 RepID=A0A165Q3G2_9APHY|nr:O-methyltransferase family 3 protein [Daedalea quercina L-15889]
MSATSAHEDWARSDAYHNSFLLAPDDALTFAKANSDKHGLRDIAVSAAQGKYLSLLVRSIGAKRVLEVGTLGGYSTIWMGRALPEDGELITLELNEKHVQVARENIAHAGLADKVKVVQGVAAESLAKMAADKPFDFVFIDADKPNNLTYLLEAKRLTRKGAVIIIDNVVRRGKVADLAYTDANCEGIRRLLTHLKTDREVEATTISTVGEKGWDGFMYVLKP